MDSRVCPEVEKTNSAYSQSIVGRRSETVVVYHFTRPEFNDATCRRDENTASLYYNLTGFGRAGARSFLGQTNAGFCFIFGFLLIFSPATVAVSCGTAGWLTVGFL